MSELLNESVQTEDTTMTVTLILETIHKEQVTSTPPATPPTKTKTKKQQAKNLVQKAIKKKNDWKKAIMQRLTNLEQQNRADAIEESIYANVLNEVRNQLPKLLPKAVSDALKKTPGNLSEPTPTPAIDPSEYELKHQLYEKMFQTAAYLKHPKHRALYDALQESMQIDELDARYGSTKPSYNIRTHDDQDPEDREGEKSKKRRRNGAGESSSMKSKDQEEPSHFERGNDVDELRQDDEQVHKGHKVQAKEITEEPEEHEYKDGSVTLFGKLVKKIFKKDKITKEDVDGPAFELLKGTIDWINPEGDKCHQDLSKPLPLTGHPGSRERTHALSVTKINEGIEEMIPSLWSPSIQKYNKDADFGICHWYPSRQLFYKGNVGFPSRHEVYSKRNIRSVQSIKVDKQYGYAYLEEIVVTRTDEKEYKFCEADFPYLNQNDIEDLYILKIQNKIRNIKGTEEYDLINALKMYIRRIVIKKIVEDVQMGVESYQTKLNLTKPQLMEGCLHQFTPYTINHPLGVVYEGVNNRKRLMIDNELYKFCDGTLKKVLRKLQIILRNNTLGYDNEGIEKYKWTKEDEKKTKKFVDKIEKTLKERRRFRRLELFVGGRRDKTDYRLLVRHE
ncbi:hypothetical protein Tco_1097703 [Tanacetum coccineum]